MFTNLCLLVIFISRQYDVKNSMGSAALSVHVGGGNCSGLIAFNHQCLYILKKQTKCKRFSLSISFFFKQISQKSKIPTEKNFTMPQHLI